MVTDRVAYEGEMKSIKIARKTSRNLKQAGRNFVQSADLAASAGRVIAARTRAAAVGDHRELSRMVPEKAAAFGAGGFALALDFARTAAQFQRSITADCIALGLHASAIARARSPFQATLVQSRGLVAWWTRMAEQSATLSAQMMRLQHDMTAPIARTARANASRLSR